jgi:hypothetical protein
MAINVGEIGKIININASFDLSSNTDLQMVFTKPDGTTTVTKTSADGVTAPGVNFTDPDTGVTFNANEYWSYPIESGLIDTAGTWAVYGVYIDATPKNFCGDGSSFVVTTCGVSASD